MLVDPVLSSKLRSGWSLLLCGVLLSACSEPAPGRESNAGSGGTPTLAAGSGGHAAGSSSEVAGSSSSRAGNGGGNAGSAAEGGKGGPGSGAQIERSTVAADDSPDVSDVDYAAFTGQLAKFGLELGQKLAESEKLTEKNLVYSPLSAAYALAMTYAGARGQTATEMKSVLGDSFMGATYHSAANRLARELAARATSQMGSDGKPRKVELNLADALFLERTLELQPAFLDLLAREYNSGVQRVDFTNDFEAARVTINDWVSDQTHEKILDLLPMGSVNARTPLVLVNALYFYGSWRTPFSHDATHPADFHTLAGETSQVPTMFVSELAAGYASSADYSLAALRYIGEHLSMTIVLPAQGKFESVRSMVSAAWLEQQIGMLKPSSLDVSLPKFKMTVGSFSLRAGLEALGMKQAFSDSADFSGIAPALAISDVLQKCFIAVDEDGTEAAAATAVVLRPTSAAVDQPIPFIVDRPFLFFVRDDNGVILFSGQVVDPSGAE